MADQKRVKISGTGDWWDSLVTCDGVPLEVAGVEISVGVDGATTVRLVLDSTMVQFDLHSSAEVPSAMPPQPPTAFQIRGSDLVAVIRKTERNQGR